MTPLNLAPIACFILTSLLWATAFYILGYWNHPLNGDELDYLTRGIQLLDEGIVSFNDGWRPPLFVMICAAVQSIFNNIPIIAIRALNLTLVSLIPALWLQASIKQKNISFSFMAIFTLIWPSFYILGTSIHAEAISFLLLNLVLLQLVQTNKFLGIKQSFYIALLFALLFLSKANNILIALTYTISILISHTTSLQPKLKHLMLTAILTTLLISPWLIYQSKVHKTFMITTTSGYNLLVGTGRYDFNMEGFSDSNTIHQSYLQSNTHLKKTEQANSALSNKQNASIENTKSLFEQHQVSTEIAVKIWRSHTLQQINYGLLKITHSIGGSLRGMKDYISLLFFIATATASIYLFKEKRYTYISIHWSLSFFGFLIAFIYLPSMRIKTFYFDYTALLCLAEFATLISASLIHKFKQQ